MAVSALRQIILITLAKISNKSDPYFSWQKFEGRYDTKHVAGLLLVYNRNKPNRPSFFESRGF